jgi:energy-coupling factor transport system permease protein
MFNNIILGQYYPVKSVLHEMNPISKILSIFLFLIISFTITNIWLYFLLIILVVIMILISKVPIKLFLNGIKSLKILMLVVFVCDYILSGNLLLSTTIVLRIIAVVLYTSILTFTTPISEITYGLEKIFAPLNHLKIPVKELALSLSLALAFIPSIFEQANKILKSQASRGIDFKYSNMRGKLIALTSMLTPMFILSFKRAENLADAMEVRLYGYSDKRTHYRINKWSEYDNNMIIIHLAMLIIFILSEVVI